MFWRIPARPLAAKTSFTDEPGVVVEFQLQEVRMKSLRIECEVVGYDANGVENFAHGEAMWWRHMGPEFSQHMENRMRQAITNAEKASANKHTNGLVATFKANVDGQDVTPKAFTGISHKEDHRFQMEVQQWRGELLHIAAGRVDEQDKRRGGK